MKVPTSWSEYLRLSTDEKKVLWEQEHYPQSDKIIWDEEPPVEMTTGRGDQFTGQVKRSAMVN